MLSRMQNFTFKAALFSAATGSFALLQVSCKQVFAPKAAKNISTLAAASNDDEPIKIIPHRAAYDSEKARLGRHLFFDPILSRDQEYSCATCHQPELYGSDGQALAPKLYGDVRPLNTPTILNAVYNFSQFWNGRAENLHDQAEGPIVGIDELAGNWSTILERLRVHPHYPKRFQSAFQTPPSREGVLESLAQYQASLTTPNAPFDRYLAGVRDAISPQARRGYDRFKSYGCISCHQGINIGGNMYQKMGVAEDYFKALERPVNTSDWGRYTVTNFESDRYYFKVPSLRNVARTAPYFHDGSAADLPKAVMLMAQYQLGIEMPESDRDDIVAFLESLTAPLPPHFKKPAPHPSGGE